MRDRDRRSARLCPQSGSFLKEIKHRGGRGWSVQVGHQDVGSSTAANLASEIWESQMTFTPRTARDITAARCARRADVFATRSTRSEMFSLFSICLCRVIRASAEMPDRSLCRAGFQPQGDRGDCAAANQACFNGITRFMRAQNVLHGINVIRGLARPTRSVRLPGKWRLCPRASRFNMDNQQSLTGG